MCKALTAFCVKFYWTKTEIFISEVDIAKILIFSSAKDLNILYVTPGLAIMPAPIIDTLETLSSCIILL